MSASTEPLTDGQRACQRRLALVGAAALYAFSAAYFAPPGLIGGILVFDPQLDLDGLTRFWSTALVVAAIALPFLIAVLATYGAEQEKNGAIGLGLLWGAWFLLWLLGAFFAWPRFHQSWAHQSFLRKLLGMDSLSLLVKAELGLPVLTLIAIVVIATRGHERKQAALAFLASLVSYVLVPVYVWAVGPIAAACSVLPQRSPWGLVASGFLVLLAWAEVRAGGFPWTTACLAPFFVVAIGGGAAATVRRLAGPSITARAAGIDDWTVAAVGEHFPIALRRLGRTAGLIALAWVLLYLLPDRIFSALFFLRPELALDSLSRFTAATFATALVTSPLTIRQLLAMARPGLFVEEQKYLAWFLSLLAVLGFGLWYGVAYWGLPALLARLDGLGPVWPALGVEATGLAVKAAVLGLALLPLAVVLGPLWREVRDSWNGPAEAPDRYRPTRAGLVVWFLLVAVVPAYLGAAAFLFAVLDCLWFTVRRPGRMALLIVPVTIGIQELSHGTWPWLALAVSALFLVQVALVAEQLDKGLAGLAAQAAAAQEEAPPRGSVFPPRVPPEMAYSPQPGTPLPLAVDKLGARGMIDDLVRASGAGEGAVRVQAVQMLAHVGNRRHLHLIQRLALEDGDPAVRRAAAICLASIGGTRAVKTLRRLAEDREPTLRWTAEEMLACLSTGHRPQLAATSGPISEEPLVRLLD